MDSAYITENTGTKALTGADGQTQQLPWKDGVRIPVWSDLPLCPLRTGNPAFTSDLTFGVLQTSVKRWPLSDTCSKGLHEIIAVLAVFKGKIPRLEWGPLPNCLVTKYVFAVIFTNSVLPFRFNHQKPCWLTSRASFEIGMPEALLPETGSRRAVSRSRPLSFSTAKLTFLSCASICSFPPSLQHTGTERRCVPGALL